MTNELYTNEIDINKVKGIMQENNADERIIDPIYHEEIILNIGKYSSISGVPSSKFFRSALEVCQESDADVQYILNLPNHIKKGKIGFIYTGNWKPSVPERMQLMGGILLRNNKVPRVLTLGMLLRELAANQQYNPKYVFVPGFVGKRTGVLLNKYNLIPEEVYDWLYERMIQGRPTILGIENLDNMEEVLEGAYSEIVALFNENYYVKRMR